MAKRVRVFKTNSSGKIEFTPQQLEALLNEMYDEGYHDGSNSQGWTYPFWYGNSIINHATTNIGDTSELNKPSIDIKLNGCVDSGTSEVADAFSKLAKELNF